MKSYFDQLLARLGLVRKSRYDAQSLIANFAVNQANSLLRDIHKAAREKFALRSERDHLRRIIDEEVEVLRMPSIAKLFSLEYRPDLSTRTHYITLDRQTHQIVVTDLQLAEAECSQALCALIAKRLATTATERLEKQILHILLEWDRSKQL